jgi:hypothetical protein
MVDSKILGQLKLHFFDSEFAVRIVDGDIGIGRLIRVKDILVKSYTELGSSLFAAAASLQSDILNGL